MSDVSAWAPRATRCRLAVARGGSPTDIDALVLDMERAGGGWWRASAPEAEPGRGYGFLLDDDPTVLADPRSRRQPDGVHQPSQFYADTFDWSDGSWSARPLSDGAVIYEAHVGTFTPEGTFDAAIERLDHLVDLGITHVEILPVNDFNGLWNWGYDGVLWYAVHEAYGGPDGLKRLVDACHGRGIAVVLDVVYNHLGPSGNHLPAFGPYLKSGQNTWGDLVNLDEDGSEEVRSYIIDNALMWLDEFHVDGLRLDAVHALQDRSEPHLLTELSERVDELSRATGRELVLIAESDLNDPVMITGRGDSGYGLHAQWDDDVHHALHAMLSGERQAYYADFGLPSVLAKVLTRGFFHDGTFSSFRGRSHGREVDTSTVMGYHFVAFLQDHDQVGNRAAGDRLAEICSSGLLRIGATLLLTSPFTPMLWMGEEWAARTPWPFFTSHPEPELADVTSSGRLSEFAEHGWDPALVPDPQDPQTFASAKLDWAELELDAHAEMLALYKNLLGLRREHSDLRDPHLDRVRVDVDDSNGWLVIHRGRFAVLVNLARHSQDVPVDSVDDVVFSTGLRPRVATSSVSLAPETACVVSLSR